MAKPCICTTITIDATNKWLDINFDDTGEAAVEILVGTYDSIFALAAQIQAELIAHVDANFIVTVLSTGLAGRIQIDCTDETEYIILWKTGVHGSDLLDTHIGDMIGHSDVADVASASGVVIGDYQAQQCWFSTMHPVTDTEDRREHIGSNFVRTLDGTKQKRLTVSTPRNREVELSYLPPELMWASDATGANINRDFETLWQTLITSEAFEYFTDQTDSATGVTYYLKEPSDFTGKKWLYPATELYDLKLSMNRQE